MPLCVCVCARARAFLAYAFIRSNKALARNLLSQSAVNSFSTLYKL